MMSFKVIISLKLKLLFTIKSQNSYLGKFSFIYF